LIAKIQSRLFAVGCRAPESACLVYFGLALMMSGKPAFRLSSGKEGCRG